MSLPDFYWDAVEKHPLQLHRLSEHSKLELHEALPKVYPQLKEETIDT